MYNNNCVASSPSMRYSIYCQRYRSSSDLLENADVSGGKCRRAISEMGQLQVENPFSIVINSSSMSPSISVSFNNLDLIDKTSPRVQRLLNTYKSFDISRSRSLNNVTILEQPIVTGSKWKGIFTRCFSI